jgi:hypothetical protein
MMPSKRLVWRRNKTLQRTEIQCLHYKNLLHESEFISFL